MNYFSEWSLLWVCILRCQSQSDVKELEEVLAMAATANKTVIITTLNEAWAANSTMIDLYLQSFHGGEKIEYLLGHMVIVTLDQKAHDRCLQLHPHCFRLKTSGVDFTGEKSFMSEDYLEMMWKRIQFLGEVLKLGYSFVFSVRITSLQFRWFCTKQILAAKFSPKFGSCEN